jgi:hypothetical protein
MAYLLVAKKINSKLRLCFAKQLQRIKFISTFSRGVYRVKHQVCTSDKSKTEPAGPSFSFLLFTPKNCP